MPYLNEVNLMGNVGRTPEVRTTQDGTKVASFSLATTRRWKKDGQPQERTEWHRIVAFGPKAERIGQYVAKGESLWVRGESRLNEYTDQDGTNWKVSEVVLSDFEFLGARKDKAARTDAVSAEADA